MPTYTAPITVDEFLVPEVFALSVAAPSVNPDRLPPALTAYIVPDSSECWIAEELASQYRQDFVGDILYLTVVEENLSEVHLYKLACPMQLRTGVSPDYVQIGLDHLRLVFDIELYTPPPYESGEARRLNLRLRNCVRYPTRPDEGELVEA